MGDKSPSAGKPALNGTLRVRHAVVTVTDPASGDTWTHHDVDWTTLRLVADADNETAAFDLTGVLHRKDGVAVTLTSPRGTVHE